MLFHRNHKQTADKRQSGEKDLYPVLYVMDTLKNKQTD